MKRNELLNALILILKRQKECMAKDGICGTFDEDHIEADKLLLKYINDEEIEKAFDDIEKWYS